MSSSTRILLGLIAGIVLGTFLSGATRVVDAGQLAGNLWLDGLRMTVVPLVFSLLVSSVSSTADLASARGVTTKALAAILVLLFAGGLLTTVVAPTVLTLWPAPAGAADALRITGQSPVPPAPPFGEWVSGLIPANVLKAAADGAMLQIVIFGLLFGFAATRIDHARREAIVGFFQAVADTMMMLVGWVLWVAPIGVFGFGLVIGAKTGLSATGILAHYVITVAISCIAILIAVYPLVFFGARLSLVRFSKAVAPAQVVAISTQSSLASLPAMLKGAEFLSIPTTVSGLVLPLAVSLFRVTSPAANLTIAIYIAHAMGIHLGPVQLVTGAAVATVISLGAVSVASQATFFAAAAPVCVAIGVPVEPLAILIAVETIPDIFRTVTNVTMDLGVTAILSRYSQNSIDTLRRGGAY